MMAATRKFCSVPILAFNVLKCAPSLNNQFLLFSVILCKSVTIQNSCSSYLTEQPGYNAILKDACLFVCLFVCFRLLCLFLCLHELLLILHPSFYFCSFSFYRTCGLMFGLRRTLFNRVLDVFLDCARRMISNATGIVLNVQLQIGNRSIKDFI